MNRYHSRLGRIGLALLAGAALSGCTLFSPVAETASLAVLDQLPETVMQQPRGEGTLLVLRPESLPPFDTTQIAYASSAHQFGYFTKQAWVATPSRMLLPLLVTTLEQTRRFKTVVTPPYVTHYSYALRTEILALTQDYTVHPVVLRLWLRSQLYDGTSGHVVATKEIKIAEPLHEKSVTAGITAANRATAQALQQLAAFVVANSS